MHWIRRSIVMAMCAAASMGAVPEAHATEGLAWQWEEGTEHTYLIQAQVRLSELLVFLATTNKDIRVVEFYFAGVSTCRSVGESGKKAWELRCTLSDVQLSAAPPKIDSDRGLVDILDEWDQTLLDAELQIVFGRDGRIRNFGLTGVDTRIQRTREIQELLRLVLQRAFASLELEMPKKGDDKGTGWRQTDMVAMSLPKSVGTMGGIRVIHQVTESSGTEVTIDSAGNGVVQSGETVGAPGQERAKNQYDLDFRGRSVFDIERGTLVSRDYLVAGEPTASSAMATGVAGALYIQAVHLELIPEGGKVAPLGPNAETVPGEGGI